MPSGNPVIPSLTFFPPEQKNSIENFDDKESQRVRTCSEFADQNWISDEEQLLTCGQLFKVARFLSEKHNKTEKIYQIITHYTIL
jgi:hypothetical protein